MDMENGHQSGAERRKFKRIKKQFTTRLRVYSGPSNADWNIVVVRNLSAGGILFLFDVNVPLGALLNFKINFLQTKDPIQCFGRVLRVKSLSASFSEVACELTEIDFKDKELISRTAEEYYSKKTGLIEP